MPTPLQGYHQFKRHCIHSVTTPCIHLTGSSIRLSLSHRAFRRRLPSQFSLGKLSGFIRTPFHLAFSTNKRLFFWNIFGLKTQVVLETMSPEKMISNLQDLAFPPSSVKTLHHTKKKYHDGGIETISVPFHCYPHTSFYCATVNLFRWSKTVLCTLSHQSIIKMA